MIDRFTYAIENSPTVTSSSCSSSRKLRPKKCTGTLLLDIRRRMGIHVLMILIFGNLFALTSLVSLAFLWFADHDNRVWRYIIIKGHLLPVVSGLSKVLEMSTAAVLSVSSAIIASILLEHHKVCLIDLPAISMARYHGGLPTLLLILRKQIRFSPWRVPFVFALLTSAILVFSSTITVLLNTDIESSQLPDYVRHFPAAVSPNITELYATNNTWRMSHGTTWLKKPSVFPTYGQYSMKFTSPDDVLDTGITLRSFLPYYIQGSRSNMHDFRSNTTVFDMRVSCQAPVLDQYKISFSNSSSTMIQLDTYLRASQMVPSFSNHTLTTSPNTNSTNHLQWVDSPWISCLAGMATLATKYNISGYQPPWRSSICQLPNGWNVGTRRYEYTGGLDSSIQEHMFESEEQRQNEPWQSWKWGNAFLILNVTSGTVGDVNNPMFANRAHLDSASFTSSTRGEWRDLKNGNLVISASLCYSSFMSADLPVHMFGKEPSFEYTPIFNSTLNRWDFTLVRQSMGQTINTSKNYKLKTLPFKQLSPLRSNWLSKSIRELAAVEPYVRSAFNMWDFTSRLEIRATPEHSQGNSQPIAMHNGSISALMLQPEQDEIKPPGGASFILPEPMISDLFQDIVTTGGGVAFALQSLFSVMAANEFYDRLLMFDIKDDQSTQKLFKAVNAPVKNKGFLAVFVMSVLHLILVAFIVTHFLRTCKHTSLGNSSWRTLSQTVSLMTLDTLSAANGMNDDEVRVMLKSHGRDHALVGLDTPGLGNHLSCQSVTHTV